MALRLLPWSPEYGTGMQFDVDASAAMNGEGSPTIEFTERRPWERVVPHAEPPAAVQIVDGVRRAEAHAMDEAADGSLVLGLFGSYAVGAVCCNGRAQLLEDHFRVERRYFQTAGDPISREIPGGNASLCFRAELPENATTANDLVAALNRKMLDEEEKLAEELSRDESILTFVDGPLRLRSPGDHVIGYIKRVHRWYLPAEHQRLLLDLAVGERTPVFRILEGAEGRHDRLSWFLRLADLRGHYHPLAGVMRLEVPGSLPCDAAAHLADQSALVLPGLASSPVRDPRSPQNLTPVGALEAALTHRLGDRRWINRLLTAAIEREAAA
ncbi:MAG TPA: hypothetical protein PLX85_07835 [Dehalococcoidia bacterium]|nr:hypothetical protein [Dehalococcoidia bacterium]